jgi:predicted dehydrogenase
LGVIVNPANPERLLPSRKLIKREIDEGKLGEPGLIRIHHWEGVAVDSSADAHELPAAVLQQIDLILWFMGKPPKLVYAVERQKEAANHQGRYLQIHLGFPGSAMALLVYSNLLPSGAPYRSLHLIGSAGAAYADDQQNMQLLYQGGQPRGVFAEEAPTKEQELVHMTQAWQHVLAVTKGVQESLQTRQAVSLEGR